MSTDDESVEDTEFEASEPNAPQDRTTPESLDGATTAAEEAVHGALVELGFVNFDGSANDNNTSGAMVSAERRLNFRRDVYVGIRDTEQHLEFLGRVVEGPFHAPHEVVSRADIKFPKSAR